MPYTFVQILGQGHFGQVRHEHDDALGREVAAKYLDPQFLTPGHEFDEARMMIGAEHDHVVRIYSADFENGQPVIRMEYLANGSIESKFHGLPAPTLEATLALEDAARGVDALHARGALHRDIKPGNLLIGDNGGIKVSDFGLACVQGHHHTAAPFGYLPHLPPEALMKNCVIEDQIGDVYALGVTAYRLYNGDEMLKAALPPGITDPTPLIITGTYPDTKRMQPHLHPPLRRVLTKALSADPKKRFQSATEFRHALEGCRPVVSWTPDPTGARSWTGHDKDGRAYQADIKQHGTTSTFRVAKGTNGKLRNVRDDELTGDHSAVAKHSAAVLQRYAQTGK